MQIGKKLSYFSGKKTNEILSFLTYIFFNHYVMKNLIKITANYISINYQYSLESINLLESNYVYRLESFINRGNYSFMNNRIQLILSTFIIFFF